MSVRHGIRLSLQRKESESEVAQSCPTLQQKEEGCECLWDDSPNYWASQVVLVVKDLPANAGDIRDMGLIPGGGHGNPLQYSCLERDRGAWRATVHGVSKS